MELQRNYIYILKELFMLLILLMHFNLLLFSWSNSQTINLKLNLSGNYFVSCDGIYHELTETNKNKYYELDKLNICDTVEIEYSENDWTIKYRFSNIKFEENDTLSLDFIHYNSLDSVQYSSSCLDGTEAETNITFKERNKGAKSINELPDNVVVKLGNKELMLFKSVESYLTIESGNGMKSKKKWGYTKTTFSNLVFYAN